MATSARAPVNEEEFLGSLYKGGELLAAGKIVEARAHLEQAHKLAPRNEKAQNLLGLTYFKLGLFDQASDIYERLVRDNPADPTLRVNLGLVYLKTNDLPRCIKEFETATDLDPEHKKAHNYLGLALAQAGDYAKAREHFVLAGSEQMAEKMTRALTARVESAPSSHGLVVPPPPPATAHAVTAQPARPSSPPPPPALPPEPPPAAEEEIEVMSDSEVMESDVTEVPADVAVPAPPPEPIDVPQEPIAIATEPMPNEVEIAPPSPSGPRLERDWGAQFGMEETPAEGTVSEELPITEGTLSEELPVIEASASAPRAWATPLVNSWDSASGLEPPKAAGAPVEPVLETTHDPAAEDPAWNAARAASEVTATDDRWNTAPDPAREMDFGDVAPTDAAPTAPTWGHTEPGAASWDAAPSTETSGFDASSYGLETGAITEPAPAPTETWQQPAETSWSDPATGADAMVESPPADATWDAGTGEAAPPAAEEWTSAQAASASDWSNVEAAVTAETPTDSATWSDEPQAEVPTSMEPAAESQAWSNEALPDGGAPTEPAGDWSSEPQSQVEAAASAELPSESQAWANEALPDGGAQTELAGDWSSEPQRQVEAPASAESPSESQDWSADPLSPNAHELAEPSDASQAWAGAQTTAASEAWTNETISEPSTEDSGSPATEAPPPEARVDSGAWVAQPLSQFGQPPPRPVPAPPPSSPTGYAPMEARTLVELGASISTIEAPDAGPFHVGPHGLAVSVNEQMLSRMTNLVAIVGSVQATPEHRRSRGRATDKPFGEGPSQMQRLTGHGVVHLEMGGARFHALDLNDDSAYLREERVFGFEETISFEHGRLSDDGQHLALDLVHLSGDGRVLLQLNGAMKSLAVPPGAPMVVPLQRLVGWFGRITPRLTGFAGQGAVELTGDGYALLVTPG